MSERVAVIGAGIIGICTALELVETGYEVCLIDPEEPGSGCSSGNAGHFATEQVFPLADPKLLLKLPAMLLDPLGPLSIRPSYLLRLLPWLWRFVSNMSAHKRVANTKTLRALCESALPAWKALLGRHNLDSHLTLNGSLLVFETTALHDIKIVQEQYLREGVSVSLLDREKLDKIEPGLAPNVTHALYFEQVGHTGNPLALSQALIEKYNDLGGEYRKAQVTQLTQQGSFWQLVLKAPVTTLNFHKAIICAGVYSKVLCQQLGYNAPLEAERGYHLDSLPVHMPQRPIASFERKLIMTPMTTGLRLAGTVEFAGINAQPNAKRADGFLTHGCKLWPALAQAPDPRCTANRWMGRRPSLPDSLPVISAARQENMYFNFGHQHLGLTLAAISAQLVTQLLDDGQCVQAQALSIERFNT